MRVLAEIRWCETHKQSTDSDETCYGFFDRRVNPCVVVDAQVTHTTAGSTPRPYNQCPDCDGTGEAVAEWGEEFQSVMEPCPTCSVEPKQTEQNKGEPRWIPLR